MDFENEGVDRATTSERGRDEETDNDDESCPSVGDDEDEDDGNDDFSNPFSDVVVVVVVVGSVLPALSRLVKDPHDGDDSKKAGRHPPSSPPRPSKRRVRSC